jgi:hypothetical protein
MEMRSLVLVAGMAILAAAPEWARAASLSGTVRGSLGAAVAHAKVTATNAATGRQTSAETDEAGHYVLSLDPGDYEISAAADGFDAKKMKATLADGDTKTLDLALAPSSGNAAAPALGDLGFPAEQTQGNAAEQARLDKRSHMLKIHQRLGLITIAPLLATIIASSGAGGRHSTASGRDLHAALGAGTAGLYLTTAAFAIFAPKIAGTKTRGPIRVHKALAWIHGPGMILTPILGAMALEQRDAGEKVHGIAKAHGAVAWVTAGAFAAAVVSVSFHF